MDKPLVSIIVPVYNVEKYLAECLESLVKQTYQNIEIICVNDGSTDKSKEILDYYEYMYSKVDVCSKSNGGLSSARNHGMRYASGKYVAFVDSDDTIEPWVIEKAVQELEKTNADLYCYGIKQFVDEEVSNKEMHKIDSTNAWFERRFKYEGLQGLDFELAEDTNIHVCNKVFRKKIIDDLEFPEGLLFEDIYFTWSYLFKSNKIFYEPQIGYNYRVHSNSIMAKSTNEKSLDKALHHLKNWERLFEDWKVGKLKNCGSCLLPLLDTLIKRTKEMSSKDTEAIINAYNDYYTNKYLEALK